MPRYSLGIDFGTLSVRALIAEIGTGREVGTAACAYPGGTRTERLPSGRPLPPGYALQDPMEYFPSLVSAVHGAIRAAAVDPRDILAIGVDATSSTFFPVDNSFRPLIADGEFLDDPGAWARLWKHHGAQREADEMTLAPASKEFLSRYGGKVSPEWMMPKLLELLRTSRRVWDRAYLFVELGDWIVQCLTGEFVAARQMAGFKAFLGPDGRYPSEKWFGAFDPEFAAAPDKLARYFLPLGSQAGRLTREAAEKLGLCPGIPVSTANIDAHVTPPAAGVTRPGELCLILGTSICHLLSSDAEKDVPGTFGRVKDGIVPRLFAYEAGQSAGGDHYDWATRTTGRDHATLSREAASLTPGSGGLIALDWWNGNRSVLNNMDLTGLICGMTLDTRPCQIYRALIEATAYGTRRIIDNFEEHGIAIDTITSSGGVSVKNPLVMHIFSDVTGREISVSRSKETTALGSAMWGAVALGERSGGYDNIQDCAAEMGGRTEQVISPDPAAVRVYRDYYEEYLYLHDLFGKDNDFMRRLREKASR